MRTYRLARFVSFLLFLAALIYFVGGLILGIFLWVNGLGAGWGSGFAGWLSIPVFVSAFFGALTLLMLGVVLYFLTAINANLTTARQSGALAAPKPEVKPTAPAAPLPPIPPRPTVAPPPVAPVARVEAPTVRGEPPPIEAAAPAVEVAAPQVEATAPASAEQPTAVLATPVAVSPDLLAELPAADADADAEAAPQEFAGRLPGADQAARIASELAAATAADEPAADEPAA